MTQQDDITQRLLTDDGLQALWDEACKDSPQAPCWNRHLRYGRAIETALLSKLRAPVSSIREGFELTYAADADDPACASDLSHFTNGWRACVMSQVRAPVADERAALQKLVDLEDMRLRLRALHENGHGTDYDHYHKALPAAWEAARAALASAPVAVPVSPDLQAQIVALRRPDWPSTGDRSSFHEGYETARVDILRLLRRSAPVAREATDTFRNLLLEAVHRYGNARALAEHDIKQRGQISTTVAAILDLLDAAPQASAEDVRNAAPEEAAALCESWMMAKTATHLQDMANQTMRRMADYIRALKQPQADKDGGQQHAGDVDERAAFEAWAYRAGMGPKFRESMFAAWEARAALSAPQAEQGERDA